MMILSNCQYVRAQVVPRLLDCFRSHGYPPNKEVENVMFTQPYGNIFHILIYIKF